MRAAFLYRTRCPTTAWCIPVWQRPPARCCSHLRNHSEMPGSQYGLGQVKDGGKQHFARRDGGHMVPQILERVQCDCKCERILNLSAGIVEASPLVRIGSMCAKAVDTGPSPETARTCTWFHFDIGKRITTKPRKASSWIHTNLGFSLQIGNPPSLCPSDQWKWTRRAPAACKKIYKNTSSPITTNTHTRARAHTHRQKNRENLMENTIFEFIIKT